MQTPKVFLDKTSQWNIHNQKLKLRKKNKRTQKNRKVICGELKLATIFFFIFCKEIWEFFSFYLESSMEMVLGQF